jgi:hypothetical protein
MHQRMQRLHARLGTAGLVVAVIALVFALAGGAIAANNNSATASKAGPRGKTGKTGKTGPQGPKGDAGPAGPQGPKGDAGSQGGVGPAGPAGVGTAGPTGPTGKTGTTGVTGATGVTGTTGVTGPAGPTCNEDGECLLPVGATETGVWSFRAINVAKASISISYPLRIPGGLTYHYVKWSEQGSVPPAVPECPSIEAAEPEALPGNLCVYEGEEGSESQLTNAAVPVKVLGSLDFSSGVPLNFALTNPANEARGTGTWAAAR